MLESAQTFAGVVADVTTALTTTQVGIYVVAGIIFGLLARMIASAKKAGR